MTLSPLDVYLQQLGVSAKHLKMQVPLCSGQMKKTTLRETHSLPIFRMSAIFTSRYKN